MKCVTAKSPRRRWMKLCELKDDWIQRGSILRRERLSNDFRQDQIAHEEFEVFVFDPLTGGNYGLIQISGKNPGSIRVVFPLESSTRGHVGLRRDWLLSNWNPWVTTDIPLFEMKIKLP